MSHRVLVTGVSGYLGGTLLAHWMSANLPSHERLYALVRTDDQANAVKQYAAEPLKFDVREEAAAREAVLGNQITVMIFLIDAFKAECKVYFIKALAEVQKSSRLDVHFLHTTGAKMFSNHAGAPIDKPLLDTEIDLYDIQKSQIPSVSSLRPAIDANNTVIEQGEALGVRCYIFVPCIVYGKGEGFGKKISIQKVAIISAARAVRRVFSVDSRQSARNFWPLVIPKPVFTR